MLTRNRIVSIEIACAESRSKSLRKKKRVSNLARKRLNQESNKGQNTENQKRKENKQNKRENKFQAET